MTFRLHKADLFNLTLEDQEAVVLEIDAFRSKELTDVLEVRFFPINAVSRYTLPVYRAGNFKLCSRNNFIIVRFILII